MFKIVNTQPALCIYRFCINGFNHPLLMDQNYSPKTCYVVADMYYVVGPTVAAHVLNTYRLFFLSLSPKPYSITTIYIVFRLY